MEEQHEEKKVLTAYTVIRYEDGSVDVRNADGFEGAAEITGDAIYKDIEEVSRMIALKRTENAAYAGVRRFYAEVSAAQEAAQKEGDTTEAE